MAAFTPVLHVAVQLLLEKTDSVRAEPGQDVSLQCNSSSDAAVTLLKWKRSGLEDSVFYFRDNRLMESYQDLRYQRRVQLKDPEMKNGDASVLLKNVDIEDTGTYECWVITLSNNRRKRNVGELVSSVHLTVSEGPKKPEGPEKEINDEQPGGSRGHVGLGVSVGLVCLIVVVVVVVGLFLKLKEPRNTDQQTDEQEMSELNP
ncbi:hypothetical protein KUCAC02_026991 [Chaenocephalus aceratus]|nr:hypothetical protein KUCAC02_026991 [Chaenocephalus aceratus]